MYTTHLPIKILTWAAVGLFLLTVACTPGGLKTIAPTAISTLPETSAAKTQPPQAAAGQGPAYQVVLQEAPSGMFRTQPLNLALRGDAPAPELPADLPPAALEALQAALKDKSPALYLLIYAGYRPSGGFSVEIDALEQGQGAQSQSLLVRYHVQNPDPTKGAVAAVTFPYVLVSVPGDFPADQVVFEPAKP